MDRAVAREQAEQMKLHEVLREFYVAFRPYMEAETREAMMPLTFRYSLDPTLNERMKQNMASTRAVQSIPQRGQTSDPALPPLVQGVGTAIEEAHRLLETLKHTSHTLGGLDGSVRPANPEPERDVDGSVPMTERVSELLRVVSNALDLAHENQKRLAVQLGRE